ncbi:potassium channel family protein [Catellatospora tritici]|uniref:potassium channel family protein n=1 Tax=Catellatospora tritici TaxID=2851566 RepID=UPI0027E11677|nr:potassium channel family protein [Catellatospora tritici]
MYLLRRLTNSPRALLFSYLLLIVVSGGLYRLFEHDKTLGDALWWAVVTASTVGYGDTYPTTVPGRILAGLLISVMVLFVIPLITAHFASKLIVNNDAFVHEEQEEIKAQLREIRAMLQARHEQPSADEPELATPLLSIARQTDQDSRSAGHEAVVRVVP